MSTRFDIAKGRLRDQDGNLLPGAADWVFDGATAAYDPVSGANIITPPAGGGGGISVDGGITINLSADGTLGVGPLANADLDAAVTVTMTSSVNRNVYGCAINANPLLVFPGKTFVNGNAVGGSDIIIHHNSGSVSGGAQNRWQLRNEEGASYTLKPGQSLRAPYNYGSIDRWVKEADPEAVVDGVLMSALATRAIKRSSEQVTVAGRSAANDGTGFTVRGFPGDSTTVDNVNVFSAPNGRYKRTHGFGRNLKFGRKINLAEDFGVAADGTDQTARVQEAIDWWNDQADTWLTSNPDSSVRQAFYLPGHGGRSVRLHSGVAIPGGNHKHLLFYGDGYWCPHGNAYGHTIWNQDYVCAGSVFQAGGPDAGNFDLFTFSDPYTYVDFRGLALGNRGAGSCLNIVGAPNHIVVCRTDDVFMFGGTVGYWAQSTVSCLANYDLHIRGCDVATRWGNSVLTDYDRAAWDVKFENVRFEFCNTAIDIHRAASVLVKGGLIQSNGQGISAHADYTIDSSTFYGIHFEANTNGDINVPQFSNLATGKVLLDNCRLVSPNNALDLPFLWDAVRVRCDSFSWPEAYGPNRATLEVRGVSIEDRAVQLDFSSGKKRVIGSLPTRFTNAKRRYRVTIGGSSNGTYQILVNAVSRASYTASGATTQQIRDDLLADLVAWGGCGATAVSTNAIDIDSPAYDGAAFVVTQSSSGSAITVGTVSHFIALDALSVGCFIEIDSIAQDFTLYAPTHAPQGFQAWIRLRQNGTGNFAVTLSGFSYGTQKYVNTGNVASAEGWLHIAFDDLNQWGVIQSLPWITGVYDPSVVVSNKVTINTTNTSNTLAHSSAALVCENPNTQSISIWSFAGVVTAGTRADFVGNVSHFVTSGAYHQFYGGLDTNDPVCNMSVVGTHVGGNGATAGAQLHVTCQSTTRVTAKIEAIASQTADVLQVESSSGTGDLLAIDAAGVPHFSTAAGIVASTTQTQGGATPLTKHTNQIATVANANDAVRLPAARTGAEVVIISYGGNALQVFPASGDQIDGQLANVSTTIATLGHAVFRAFDDTNWRKM